MKRYDTSNVNGMKLNVNNEILPYLEMISVIFSAFLDIEFKGALSTFAKNVLRLKHANESDLVLTTSV